MFGVAVGAYFSLRASDYPARWLGEDHSILIMRDTRWCLVIWSFPPEDFEPVDWGHSMTRTSPSLVQSQNCGFMAAPSTLSNTRKIDAHSSYLLSSTNWYFFGDAERMFMLGGVATGLCLLFQGYVLVTKRRKSFVRIAGILGPICSLIPYFFYIPLNTLKSEDNQIWIRFPALYELATMSLLLAALIIVLNVALVGFIVGMCDCCTGTCPGFSNCSCEYTLQLVDPACYCNGICCGLLWFFIVFALVGNFSLAFNFDFDFRLDFSFSIYLEVLKVLTWISLTTDLVAGLICLRWMCQGCPAADEDESRV
eukprot:Skav221231  [mRNA]  locus=scaffold1136:94656:95585:+ [translate_table: standard]